MDEYEEKQYLRYYAESIMAQYERNEYSDLRVYRIIAQDAVYRDFINAATNPDYILKGKDFINIVYMLEMAREIRIDEDFSVWYRKLIKNNDFKAKFKRLISDIEAQKIKALAERLETDKEKMEYVNNNEPTDTGINWERYIDREKIPEELKTRNIATQTEIYSEKRDAINYIEGFVGFGHNYEIKMRKSQIQDIKADVMRYILDENGQIKKEIVLDAYYKDKLPIIKMLLRNVGRICSVEEQDNKLVLKTTSVLEKEINEPDLDID